MASSFSDLERLIDTVPQMCGGAGIDCVIYKSHRELFRYSAGYADVEQQLPMKSNALYNIYSATKVITCTAAMQLVEQGRLVLTDPVHAYLPEFRDMKVKLGTFAVVPAKRPIRIVDLFTMSAGLSYDLDTPQLRKLTAETGGNFCTRDFVSALAREPLLFEPGEGWNYSYCHDVLAAVIEEIMGMPFSQCLRRSIFDPLGMQDTFFAVPEEKLSRLAPQYEYNYEIGTVRRITSDCLGAAGLHHESGGGGLITSVDDYIRFADALACDGTASNGERILSGDTIGLMHRNFLDEKRLKDFWRMGYTRGTGYGLGIAMVMDAAAACTLTPETAFYWGGIGGVQVLINPAKQTSLYVAQHTFGCPSDKFKPRMWNIFHSCV